VVVGLVEKGAPDVVLRFLGPGFVGRAVPAREAREVAVVFIGLELGDFGRDGGATSAAMGRREAEEVRSAAWVRCRSSIEYAVKEVERLVGLGDRSVHLPNHPTKLSRPHAPAACKEKPAAITTLQSAAA
jgi:hypothetical protein